METKSANNHVAMTSLSICRLMVPNHILVFSNPNSSQVPVIQEQVTGTRNYIQTALFYYVLKNSEYLNGSVIFDL